MTGSASENCRAVTCLSFSTSATVAGSSAAAPTTRMSAGARMPGCRGPGGGTEWLSSMVGAAVVPGAPGETLEDGFGSAERASPEHAAHRSSTATAAVAVSARRYPCHRPSR